MTTTRATARAVLVDIEGTTSTIAFVHDVLFPYADEHLDAYVAAHRADPEVAQAMLQAAQEIRGEAKLGRAQAIGHSAQLGDPQAIGQAAQLGDAQAIGQAAQFAGEEPVDDAAVLAHLHAWIAEDRKATPLKTLQGLIWADGYAHTGLRGHVYPDAAAGLRRWHEAGLRLYVYSSGSVEAQRVLFAHSDQGDLSALFSGYFDTTTGPKREPRSYTAIAAAIDLPPHDVLFLSDVDAELDAARAAEMQTIRLLRPADTPPGATTTHPSATSFDEIDVALPP